MCKTPELNSEPTHFLTFMKKCKPLMAWQIYQTNFSFYEYWISLDLQKPNLLENNPSNTRNKKKCQIKNKKNRGSILWKD